MRALTLWQPWASLVASGAKMIETRSWAAPRGLWGQRIAIHAAKRPITLDDIWQWPPALRSAVAALVRPVHYPLPHPPRTRDIALREACESLPYGALVASTRLVFCGQVRNVGGKQMMWVPAHTDGETHHADTALALPAQPETDYGDYSEGRWCHYYEDTRELGDPIPCRGRQQFWDVPAEIGERIPLIHSLNIDPLNE